jgi:NTE family protein
LTKDRERDIRFHDKTDYDIKLSLNVSDYHTFVEKMTELVSDSIKEIKDRKPIVDQLKQRFETIINAEQRTLTRENEPRYFYDLIGKRFDINDVLKIQRRDDEYTISDKIYDFSSATVSDLINQGEKDALLAMLEHKEKITYKDTQRGKEESMYNQLTKFIEDVNKSNTEFDQNIIQCTQKEFQKKPA